MLKINVKYQLKNTLIRINIDDTEPKNLCSSWSVWHW